eukprot:3846254-Rhodomonas_salina.1
MHQAQNHHHSFSFSYFSLSNEWDAGPKREVKKDLARAVHVSARSRDPSSRVSGTIIACITTDQRTTDAAGHTCPQPPSQALPLALSWLPPPTLSAPSRPGFRE